MKVLGLILLFPLVLAAFVIGIVLTVLGAVFGSLAGVFGSLIAIALPILMVLAAFVFFAFLIKIALPIAIVVGLVWLVVKATQPRDTPPPALPPATL